MTGAVTRPRPDRAPSVDPSVGLDVSAGRHGVIVVFAPSQHARESRVAVPLDAPVIRAPSWDAVLAMAPLADAVLAVPGGDATSRLELARAFSRVVGDRSRRASRPDEQTVLSHGVSRAGWPRSVAERRRVPLVMCAPDVERDELTRAGATKVVATDGFACGRLWLVVEAAAVTALLEEFGDRLPELRIGDALRNALLLLCAAPCPASIIAVCAALGVHRRTLWYQWQARVRSRAPGARLEDAVASAVFAHALALWSEGATWSAVATAVGVHRHTLGRVAARIIGLDGLPIRNDAAAHAAYVATARALVTHLVRPVVGSTMR
jgi:hypothetical protein